MLRSDALAGNKFGGVFVPIVSPFHESGEMDWESAERLLEFQSKQEINGIVVNGTTGEGNALSLEEKKEWISLASKFRKENKTTWKLITGTGSQSLEESAEIAKEARRAGLDAVLALPPKANELPILEFYASLNSIARIPLIAYHVPKISGNPLETKSVQSMVAKGTVIGVKDSGKSESQLKQWKTGLNELVLFVGEDSLIQLGVVEGDADAVISGTANVFPKETIELFNESKLGNGKELQLRLNEKNQSIREEGNFIAGLKQSLKSQGIISSDFKRAP